LSQRSGLTMRSLRLKRFLWVRYGPDALHALLFRGFRLDELYAACVAGVRAADLFWGEMMAFDARAP